MTCPRVGDVLVDRYRLLEVLGRGGAAIVYRALDEAHGRQVALKRFSPGPTQAESRLYALGLFEHEFHVLSQLSHPRVVEVYDYLRDGNSALYTMELLDGGDLGSLSPLGWRRACAILCDVCSALCLIHSRRLVHRDVTSTNIRCTENDQAKLIDFGAMVPMSAGNKAVGTPAFCPPEVLEWQQLDARTDLYSVGAALYYALCGRHAYPARALRQLRAVWQTPPALPSECRSGIPPALDDLVMELIQLDREARPGSAAEVMERLSAIAGVPIDEQLRVSQAYLTTPNLVGRDAELGRVARRLQRVRRSSGTSMLVWGRPGVGRSRFLDACALRAKLLGCTVVRAGRDDAGHDAYSVVRHLATQLHDMHPEFVEQAEAAHVGVLGHLLPDVLARHSGVALQELESGAQRRALLQEALQSVVRALSELRSLVFVVDDVDGIDEPSAAFLALLASEARSHRIAIVASATARQLDLTGAALRLLGRVSTHVTLQALSQDESEELFASIFGHVSHLGFVAKRLHELTEGNPRDLMELAHHLVDRGVAQYRAGSWILPSAIDAGDLPDSMARARDERVADLSEAERRLAQAFSLAPEDAFTMEQALVLAGHGDRATLLGTLASLQRNHVLRRAGETHTLSRAGWIAPLRASIDESLRSLLHRRLAEVFAAKGDPLRQGQHLLMAGQEQRALDVLTEHAATSKRITLANVDDWVSFLDDLPSDCEQTYERALELSESLGRPALERHQLLERMAPIFSARDGDSWPYVTAAIARLCHDCGFDVYAALGSEGLEPAVRTRQALAAAHQRYESLPACKRVHPPDKATMALLPNVLEALNMSSIWYDRVRWRQIPSLEPLVSLGPLFGFVEDLRRAVGERLSGRTLSCIDVYTQLLERLEQPGRAGVSGTYYHSTRDSLLSARGLLYAAMGVPQVLDDAAALETSNVHQLTPKLLRRLHSLWQGDGERADRHRHEFELAQVQRRFSTPYESGAVFTELYVLALTDDLARLRPLMPAVEHRARRSRAWLPMLRYGQGQRLRIRGDLRRALAATEEGLALTVPGEHQLWPALAGAEIDCLTRLERADEAVERGRRHLEAAEANELVFGAVDIELPLALALSAQGQHEESCAKAQRVIDHLERLGSSGLRPALAYEALAQACLAAGDGPAFDSAAHQCALILGRSKSQALATRYQTLLRRAHRARRGAAAAGNGLAIRQPQSGVLLVQQTTALESCTEFEERVRVAARLLAQHSKASEVFIYVPDGEGSLRLAGSLGEADAPPFLQTLAEGYLNAEIGPGDATQTESGASQATQPATEWESHDGTWFYPVLLAHEAGEYFVVSGVAALQCKPGAEFHHPAPLAVELSRVGLRQGAGDDDVVRLRRSSGPRSVT